MRCRTIYFLSLCTLMAMPALGQVSSKATTLTTACTFADGKSMSADYQPQAGDGRKELPKGKIWGPGDAPMYLLTQADVSVGGKDLAAGAYAMYLIPGEDEWTLVINKNVTAGSKYDEGDDLVRAPMQTGKLDEAQPFQIAFPHMAPKQCNIRVYYGKFGMWIAFHEK
ncbi:MAG: DUF2911 domain-containing protein [Acidobacteriaceae bacterium]